MWPQQHQKQQHMNLLIALLSSILQWQWTDGNDEARKCYVEGESNNNNNNIINNYINEATTTESGRSLRYRSLSCKIECLQPMFLRRSDVPVPISLTFIN